MRTAFLGLLLLLTACSYDDPSLAGHFKCDADHPCPSGQTCVNAVCTGGSSSVDAPDQPGHPDGVKCGAAGTCPAGMQCCAGPITTPVCQPMGTACSANGAGAASCDGIEDCGANQACCGSTDAACGPRTCSPQACQTADDCVGGGSCSRMLSYLPWGFCS